jgi:hypothetical protein
MINVTEKRRITCRKLNEKLVGDGIEWKCGVLDGVIL